MGFSRQEYWSRLPCPPPCDLHDPGIEPVSPALQADSLPAEPSAAAAKSLKSCLTLCDPIDGSPPGSPIPGILQARILEWVAISFSNAWKWKVKVKSLSRVWLFATPWTTAYQAPPPMGFSRQEYWSGVPLPSPAEPSEVPLEAYKSHEWFLVFEHEINADEMRNNIFKYPFTVENTEVQNSRWFLKILYPCRDRKSIWDYRDIFFFSLQHFKTIISK